MSKPCENCGADLKVCKDCDLYTGKYFKAELQSELEYLKAEIDKADSQYFYGFYIKKPAIFQIIDNRIKKLKEK